MSAGSHLIISAVAAALLALGGCGTDSDSLGSSVAGQRCASSSDCPSNKPCSSDGYCGGKLGSAPAGASAPATNLPPPPPAAQPPAEVCDNQKDDDGDGLSDCSDIDCQREPACTTKPGACNGYNCPCDVLLQNCQSPAHRCYPGGELAADGQCYAAGTVALGAPCVEPPVDTAKACGKGLLCVSTDELTPGTCAAICGPSKPCPAGFSCFALDVGSAGTVNYGVCAPSPPPPPPPPCSPVQQNCSKAGNACSPVQGGATSCALAGTAPAGTLCTDTSDCAAGLMCASLFGTSPGVAWFGFANSRAGECLPMCEPSAPSCPGQLACSPLMDGSMQRSDVGICFAVP